MKKKTLALIAAAVLTATMSFARPRKAAEITMSGYEGSSTLENFPVLVRISPERIAGFSYADCAEGGADISFVAADGTTLLAHEVDTWDTTGESLVWVRVPSVSGTDTTFTFRWNDAAPPSVTSSDVWSAGYAGVWHLNEAGNGAQSVADATANALSGIGNASSVAATGMIGGARGIRKDAKNGPTVTVTAPGTAIDDLPPSFTVSGWFCPHTGAPNWAYIFSRKDADGYQSWGAQFRGNDNSGKFTGIAVYTCGTSDKQNVVINTASKFAQGTWAYYSVVYDDTTVRLYINGDLIDSKAASQGAAVNGSLDFGIGGVIGTGGHGTFNADHDEVRLRAGVSSADWTGAEYATVATENFLTYGAAEMIISDGEFQIFGNPAAIGSSTPAYGVVDGLSAGDSRTITMAATAIAGEGTIRNYLRGWKLESVDIDTGARALLRSSSDAGEAIDRCDYVHASYAEFTWLWDVRDILGVSAPTLVSRGASSLALSADVTGIGYTAPSATLKFIYGPSPDALSMTNTVSAEVSAIGTLQGTILRLAPQSVYYVRAVLETNDAEPETVLSDVVAFATDSLPDTGQPGLWQAFFTGAKNNWKTGEVMDLPIGTDWHCYADGSRIRRRETTPIGAYTGGGSIAACSHYTSEVWGDEVYWPANGGQWAYAGYIFLDSAKSYKFRFKIDDYGYVAVTDSGTRERKVLLNDGGDAVKTSATYSPSVSGWHFIELGFADNTGGIGGRDASNNYLNSNNLGFSQDGGTTWELLRDPGDGSLFRTLPQLAEIEATENIANGALASVSLSFGASDAARTLRVAYGPAYGGNDPADWAATADAAAIPAGETTATFAVPASWGTDENLAMCFYFVLGEDEVDWSNAIFWRDYSAPSVTDIALDGTGGDTLVVSGTLASFSGSGCTLTVFTGDSPATATNAWTGLPGSVLSSTGDFSLTLFDGDSASPRRLVPGAEYYVSVVAISDGRASATEVSSVTMSAAPVFNSSSASISRRTITFSGAFRDLGMGGAASVSLYVGAASDSENALVKSGESIEVTESYSTFSFTHVFPAFDVNYKWQLRAVSTAAGGTATLESRTDVATVATKDSTTYTWTGAGDDNKWSNPANWTDDQGGDCIGAPLSAGSTARILKTASVDLDVTTTIASLNLAASDVDIVLTSASTVDYRLTLNGLSLPLDNTTWTIDGAYVTHAADLTPNAGSHVVIRNGGYLYCNSLHDKAAGAVWEVGADGTNDVANLYIAAGGAVVVSNGYMKVRGNTYLTDNSAKGELIFKGTHPSLHMSSNGGYFRSNFATPQATLGFEIPEGGYDAPPITCVSGNTRTFFDTASSAGVSIKVLGTSGAYRGAATTTTTLARWPKGYSAYMTYVPPATADLGGGFAVENTTDLKVTVVPQDRGDRLTIVSERGTPSPAAGVHTGYAQGSAYPLSAGPAVSVSATERYVPVGWRLYTVDPFTDEMTFVDAGAGDTLQYVHPGEAAAVEWVWRRECATAVSTDGHGTAAVSAEWAGEDSSVVATATPADGWRFSYWSGDVIDVPILENPAKVPADRPRALVANFVAADTEVVDNTYKGAKDGSWNTDSNWSLGHVPTAEENAIVPSGKGTVKITNEGRCASLRIVSDSSLQLLGSGTVADGQIRLDVRGNAVAFGPGFTLGNGELSAYNVLFNVGGDLCISNNNKSVSFKVYAGDAYGSSANSAILAGYAGETSSPRIRDYWRGGAQVNVGGKFFLGGSHASNTSTLTLYSHFKTGLSPVFRVGSLEIGARGAVDGYQNGWRSYNGVGLFGLGSARRSGGGASYGGHGGWPTVVDGGACGATYGFANAPYWPGSAGGIGGSDGGHGGSLFRVHARGEVRVDGSVNVNGRDWWSTGRGGGSGGGVWITCDTFDAGASAKISAKGGGQSVASSPAGGGGRVAVAVGCVSDRDIRSFLETGDCAGYVATDFSETLWPSLVNVSGGANTAVLAVHNDWNDGLAGTAKFLQNANGKSVLTIFGSPLMVGEAAPEYVTHIVDTGDVVCENSAYGYVPGTSGGSRYALAGYVWTNAVTHGAGTAASVTVPVQGETTLVWLWRDLEHNLVATSGGYGTVSAHDDWIADGETVTLAATPDAGATFVRWIGDIDAADAANAEITFTMTAPRRLVAVFDKPSAAPRSLTYSGGDWFDPATWDGTAIPGTNDTVEATGEVSFPFGAAIDFGSLHISGGSLTVGALGGAYNPAASSDFETPFLLHLHGDLVVDGASTLDIGELDGAIRTDLIVDGDLTIAGTAVVHAYASVGEADDALRTWRHYKAGGASVSVGGDINVEGSAKVFNHCHGQSGVGVVWHADGDFTLGTSAQFNGSEFSSYDKDRGNTTRAYGYGWRWPHGINVISSGTGSHGGAGGNRAADTVYGYAYAPFLPGSPGNGKKDERKGEGGGTVRIDAGGAVVLNGKIYVTGGNNDGGGNNAGAGGGVWITCDTFAAGASAIIDACGGCSTQHGTCGGGGGGRVCIITGSLSEEQIDSLYATGVAEDVLVVAEDMGNKLLSPWPTLVDVRGGINEENAANTSYSNHGKPGTAVYLQNAAGKAVITVTGNQDTTETVPAYGQSTVETGAQTFTAPAFIFFDDGRSRYPCLGYEWEDAAGNTGSGATTSFTLDVRRDLTVTWHWGTLEHFLDVRDGGLCTVSYAAQGDNAPGWYDEGTVVRVTCAPADADTMFDAWLGDVAIADKAKASIDITVDRPKVIVATLHRGAARARSLVWTGEAGDADWFNKVNWDGLAIPGRYDAVLVTNGAFQARYPAEIEVASLAVTNATGFLFCKTNTATFAQIDAYTTAIDDFDPRPSALSVAGDFSVGGLARIYCGGIEQAFRVDVSVGGNATLGGGTKSSNRSRLQIYAMDMGAWDNLDNYRVGGGSLTVGGTFALEGFAQFTPAGCRKSGAVVPVKAARVVIGQNAEINASCRGFGRSFFNPGTGWRKTLYGYATSGSNNFGGTYGGQGGYNDTESFGYIAAPFYPGSTGNTGASNTGEIFSGGGAVRIDAHEIVLDGKILANAHGGHTVGSGAGGGVWLTCNKFSLGGNALIEARHSDGSSYSGTGGGGGGRIAIGLKFNAARIARLYRAGVVTNMAVTPLAEIVAGTDLCARYGIDWTGHFNVDAGMGPGDGRNGTVGTAVLVEAPSAGTMLILR